MHRLYGRDDVLAQARRRVEQACAGHGRLLLFTGEPGIGKSRLAEQLAADAAARGARVAFGRAGKPEVPRHTGRGHRFFAS